MAWIRPAGLVLLALAGTAEVGAAERAAAPKQAATPEAVDAEMLRDLDLLSSPDYARDREVARRMGFFERLRMLEGQRAQDAATSGSPTTTAPGEDAR
ncbi:MAG TPA: hypothetical protein VL086_12420 [Candidatus Nitrosotalea sp.]|nr:hypothetical protein [Candidatus Nitrosotalea sp.]